jgi:hypothetical protein
MPHNPFVPYLNRYTTASPDHEAAFDEFIGQTPPPGGAPLRLETRTEAFVRDCFARPRPPSVILTGNAGDGKTYLCRQIVAAFTGQAVVDWADRLDWPIERNGVTLRVVKDLSEMAEEAGANLLWELALDQLEAQPRFVFLIAANEGRLRAVLQRERLEDLYREIDRQLREGPDLGNDRLIVLNLNQVTTSTYVPPALAWLTDPARWEACAACPAREACPIYFNASRLAEPSIARRMQRLYQVLEHLGVHVTIRDMLIHLAYTVTGGLDCDRIQGQPPLHWEPQRHVYYENVWGEAADEHFRRKAVVIRHLRRLNVGQMSVFEVDDFIINGRPADPAAQAEHERLFAPALDLGGRRFGQERAAYLYGGATAPRPEEEHPLMQWLPHCRRKLFFEWQETTAADRLFPFQHLPEYFRLVDGDPARLAHYRHEIILGLNRAFSGLYLTDADALYVTSQYAHAVEQPVPLVRLKIPADGIALQPAPAQTTAFDRDLTTLRLVIYPPPGVKAEPLTWPVDLLRFEYLMRRARGSTPDILAEECELSIRQLKDDLLARFAVGSPPGRIDFFAADRNRYTFRTLWVDTDGRIRI